MAEGDGACDGNIKPKLRKGDGLSSFSSATSVDSDNVTGNLPTFNTWTQFSGMPTHNVSESAGTFSWDVFTPSSNSTYGASLGDLDKNPTDFMTSYQHYLAAAAQQQLTTDITDKSHSSFNLQDASQECKDMYGDALSNWNAFSAYDPFGTPDPLPKVPIIDEDHGLKRSRSLSGNSSKPTYSDVAKTLKTKPIQHQTSREKEEADITRRKVPEPIVRPPFKPIINRRAHVARQHSKSQSSMADDMVSTVLPDSKYGLDQFEEVLPGGEGIKQASDSMENLSTLTRKGSTSSVSSGTSGIEEIQLTSHAKKDTGSDDTGYTSKASTKLFFDARRIFQGKDKRTASCNSSNGASGSTMLNNGKPACGSKTSSSAHRKTTDYINNDLRDSKKKINQNLQSRDNDSKKHDGLSQNGKVDKKSKQSGSGDPNVPGRNNKNRRQMFLPGTFDQEYFDEWINITSEKLKSISAFIWSSFVTFILLVFGIIVYLVSGCVHIMGIVWTHVSHFVKTRFLKKYFADSASWNSRKKKIGLEENITLPSTGDEAMQRLLSCKGKDPYSILGLRCDACDDDIRKYYRKQAVLVHPDKNKQPGAEEAFKILGHAFELIGEPDKRRSYDFEATEVEVVMKDLLTKLQEAANMMRCDNCGGKHKRVPVDRPWYSARFCKRCNIRHSAKEGDVWAETSVFGFLWHYYACMEGQIYDITEWVSCKKDFFKHMQASAHHVFYRIATEGNRGNSNQQRSGEADLEDFINHLFHQAMHSDGSGNQWQQPQSPSNSSQNSQSWSSNTNTGTAGKKSRRRKKKH